MPPPLSEATREAVRQLAPFGTREDVARLTGVSRSMVDRIKHGRVRVSKGVHPHAGKLDAAKVREIRARAGSVSNCALGREYGVSETMIRHVIAGRAWASVE